MKKETEAHRGGGGSGRATLNVEGRVPTLLYTHQLGYSLIYCEIY